MKLNKKVLLGLGILATGIMPVAAVVSCGSSKKTVSNGGGLPTDGNNDDTENLLKIGSWNIANLNVGQYSNSRIATLSQIISDAYIDVLGIQETDNLTAVYKLVDKLNAINKTGYAWKAIVSPYLYKAREEEGQAKQMTSISAGEYSVFLYNANKLKVKPFKDGSIGELYENGWAINEFIGDDAGNKMSAYVRAPFGVQFETSEGKDFTLVTAHLDSPGGKGKTSESTIKNGFSDTNATPGKATYETTLSSKDNPYGAGFGSQELWEAKNLNKVMEWFDQKNGADSDLIFMGDTNIKFNKDKENPFQPLIDSGYTEMLDPSKKENGTVFNRKVSDYNTLFTETSNTYDKFFNKSTMTKSGSAKRLDIAKILEQNSEFFKDKRQSGAVLSGTGIGDHFSSKVSDHDMIVQDLNLSQDEDGHSTTKAGEIKNRVFDVNTASYFDLLTNATLDKRIVERIMYYRNLVGKIDKDVMENILMNNYFNGGWHKTFMSTLAKRNVELTYVDAPAKSGNEEILDNSSFITKKEIRAITKLDVNTMSYKELKTKVDEGLISELALNKILELRNSSNPQAVTLDAFNDEKFEYKKLYEGVFDFTGIVTGVSNPFSVNTASISDMIDGLTGYDYAPLKTYDVYAIAAYRTQVGPITKDVLASIIGDYAAGHMNNALFTDTVPESAKVASLAQKLNINSIINDDAAYKMFEKIMGKNAPYIKKALERIVKEQTANTPPETKVKINGAKTFAEATKGVYNPQYFELQFGQIFDYQPIEYTTPKEVKVSSTISIDEMKAKAAVSKDANEFVDWMIAKVGGEAKMDEITGSSKGSSGIGEMSFTQIKYLWQALKERGATITNYDSLVAAAQAVHNYSLSSVKKYEVLKKILGLTTK